MTRVKALLDAGAMKAPNATKPGGETFLRFAFVSSPAAGSEASRLAANLEIVRLLIRAGADPNEAAFESNWPLTLAIYRGHEAVQTLLDGGADPNRLDGAGRPLWWDALGYRADGLRTLEVLPDHGANLEFRTSGSDVYGAAAWAAYREDWDGLLLLLDRGAPDCRGDAVFGTTVSGMVRRASSVPSAGARVRELARRYSVTD